MKPHPYEVIIWWSAEELSFVAEVPDLPGCMAHGTTRAEALAQAEAAIGVWVQTAEVDGVDVPELNGVLLFA